MLHIQSFVFSPIQENTYVLYNDAGDCAIIDPGCYHKYEEVQLATFIEKNGLSVKMLLQTHCHLDHVFGLRWTAEKYGLQPHMHQNEQHMLQLAPVSGEMWNLPFKNYEGPVIFIKEHQQLQLGLDILKVIFAPGHSPGHVCFYCEAQDFVIGGDVLFAGSIGRTDLPGGNFNHLIDSIKTQLLVLPEKTVVYSGHGPATTIGEEKAHNPYLKQN